MHGAIICLRLSWKAQEKMSRELMVSMGSGVLVLFRLRRNTCRASSDDYLLPTYLHFIWIEAYKYIRGHDRVAGGKLDQVLGGGSTFK